MLAIVAIVLNGLSMVATIIATAIPYWSHMSLLGASASIGLWKVCGSAPGVSSQCADWPEVPDWLEAVRAFEILGILGLAAALGLGILNIIKKDQYVLQRTAYVCSFVSGAFIILGAIIWAVKWEDAALSVTGLSLYAGFGVAIVAGVGAKITGWCYVIAVRQQIIQPGTTINRY